MNDEPVTDVDKLPEVHRLEIRAAVKAEGRLLRAELICLLVVGVFLVVRQLWLV